MRKIEIVISLASALAAFGVTGCSTFHYITLPAVGPDPAAQTDAERHGVLEVYTAFANLADSRPTVQPAHTDYTIFLDDTWFSEGVHNYRNVDDAQPKLVPLAAGTYNILAQSGDTNRGTSTILIPVVIKAGRTTKVYLDGEWQPSGLSMGAQFVRLPSGEPVGWSAGKN